MKERRSTKSGSPKRVFLQIIFSLFCLAGAAGGAWLFWTDLNRLLGRSAEQSVGRVSYKRNTVQRRFGDRLAWSMLPSESPVYNGDLIRTAELSDASVTLVSGDKIGLTENSLIVIHYDAATGEAKMELLGGKINLHSQSGKAAILAGGQELRPEAGGNVEAAGGAESAEFQALSGEAAVTGQGEAVALTSGQTLSSGSGGVSLVAEPVSVLRPLPDEEFEAAGDVQFAWKYNEPPGEEHIRIEVSSGRRFTEIARTDEYGAAVTAAGISLAPGVWWWRLSRSGGESGAPFSVVREGRITVSAPPEPPPAAVAALASPKALEVLSQESPLTVPLRAEEAPPEMEPPPAPPEEPAPPPAPRPAVQPPAPPPVQTPQPVLLPRAGGLAPSAGTVIDGEFFRNSRFIVLSWNTVSGADAYLCTVRQGAEITRQVYGTRLEIDPRGTLVNGPCVWRVEAVRLAADGSIARRGLVAESRFTVAVPRPETPRLDNPGIIYEE